MDVFACKVIRELRPNANIRALLIRIDPPVSYTSRDKSGITLAEIVIVAHHDIARSIYPLPESPISVMILVPHERGDSRNRTVRTEVGKYTAVWEASIWRVEEGAGRK